MKLFRLFKISPGSQLFAPSTMCGQFAFWTVTILVILMLLATAMWGTSQSINNGTVSVTTATLVWSAFVLIGWWWPYIFFKCDIPDREICSGKTNSWDDDNRRTTVQVHTPVTSQMIVWMLEAFAPWCWPKLAVQGLFWCASNMCKPSAQVSELAKAQGELAMVKSQLAAVQATALAPSAPPSLVGDPKV